MTKTTSQSPLTESKAKALETSAFATRGSENIYHLAGKDPNRAYKCISFRKFQMNGYQDFRGWQPLTKQTRTTEQWHDSEEMYGVKGDGFAHVGDLIQAWMPLEVYKAHRATLQKKTELRTDGVLTQAERLARKHNVPFEGSTQSEMYCAPLR